jgi:hypothetical protein
MKAKIMECSKSLKELDFKKLEKILFQLKVTIQDFNPAILFNSTPKKNKKE